MPYQGFTPGDRVQVLEGPTGTIVAATEAGAFFVLLDQDQGDGWWAEAELTRTALRATAAHTAEVQRRMAAEDYPELEGVLDQRPDLPRVVEEGEATRLTLSMGHTAFYLPLHGDGGGKNAAYDEGYEQGRLGTHQQPSNNDPAWMADYLLGWAYGIKDRSQVPEPRQTQTLYADDPNIPDMNFDPEMGGPGSWLRSASLSTDAGFIDFLMGSDEPSETWAGPGRNWSYDWCFLPDAPVMMADGTEKPISEVQVGDEVITHLGNIREVTWVGSRAFEGDLSRVKVFGDSTREFVATSNHRVWSQTGDQTGWHEVGDLQAGDHLTRSVLVEQRPLVMDVVQPPRGGWGVAGAKGVTCRPDKPTPWVFRTKDGSRHYATQDEAVAASVAYHRPEVMSVKVDEPLAWVLGLYAGDGFIPTRNGYAVSFSLHADQAHLVDRLQVVVRERFGVEAFVYPEPGKQAVRVDVRHWAFQALCDAQVGRTSHGKALSVGIMTMPLAEQQAFLDGYMAADGHDRADGGHNCSSVSPALPRQIREIRARLGGTCNQRWDTRGEDAFDNARPSIRTEWWSGKNHLSRQHIKDGQVHHQIVSVEREHYVGEVWDIEVDQDHSFRAYGFNVHNCRFRRESHCWLPKELNREASNIAGYAVWVPEDRGHCKRVSWDDQQACPVPSQPGPNVPGGFTDATVAWEDGGQRDGVPASYVTDKIAAKDDDSFAWHYTAAWADVQDKAIDIARGGKVRVLSVQMYDELHPETFYGQVASPTGEVYDTGLQFVPGSWKVAFWECTCKWAQYAWGRTRQWVKFEGRMCSHALALVYEMQSRGMSGMPDSEDEIAPDWVPKVAARDKVTREDFPVVQAMLDTGAPVAKVHAALHRLGMAEQKVAVKGRVRGKINGVVQDLEFDDGQVFLHGQPYDGPVLYPDYDPFRGLTASLTTESDMVNPTESARWNLSTPTEPVVHEADMTITAGAVFSRSEQDEIINEGEGHTASNLDSLDLDGTHYVQMEEPDDDPTILW